MDPNLNEPMGVKMHPIALLGVVDHFERTVGNKQKKRAVGALLGENNKGVLEVTNSFAVPFDEDPNQPGIFFIDHNYFETMYTMFKKINIKEKILGWYITGTSFREQDVDLNEIWAQYTPNPVLIVVDVKQRREFELPTKAFYSVRSVNSKGMVVRGFKNIPCSVAAFEAEEVGVEHLVREIKDLNMDTLQMKLNNKAASLLALERKVATISKYLEDVLAGRRKQDPQIMLTLHEIVSRLPRVMNEQFKKVISENINDNYVTLYTSGLVKGVVSIHNLLNNRIKNAEDQKAEDEAKAKDAEEKAKAAAQKPTEVKS
jgi:26S proteasome regulatory subunit N8